MIRIMLKPGDRVRFSEHGLQQVFGCVRGLEPMKRATYTITKVGQSSMCDDADVRLVEVDDTEVSRFWIDTLCRSRCRS
jgi:hypothetical protein